MPSARPSEKDFDAGRTGHERPARGPLGTLDRAISRARLALLVEDFWPRLVWPLSVAALFLAVSFAGLWTSVPAAARIALLVVFALAFLAALVPLLRVRRPSVEAAVGRVEARSALRHRPAATLRDRLSPVADDPAALALWTAHRKRLLGELKGLRAGPPSPDMPRRDPNALRFALPVLLAVAFMAAGSERWTRVADAFAPLEPRVSAAAGARIDAWIDPPAYTRLPPITLGQQARTATAATAEGAAQAAAPSAAVSVPAGSKVTVRIVSREPLAVTVGPEGGAARLAPEEAVGAPAAPATASAATSAPAETIRVYTATLEKDGVIAVGEPSAEAALAEAAPADAALWRYTLIPDKPPTIAEAPAGAPEAAARTKALALVFDVADDYGLAGGTLTLRPKDMKPGARPLVEPPSLPLRIGRLKDGAGKAQAVVRLEEHPYAGVASIAEAVVTDAAGQEGRTGAGEDGIVVPGRSFRNGMARALVEQRRRLALDANAVPDIGEALDAMMIAPDVFIKDDGIYLGLRVAKRRLAAARTDDELRAMLDYFWQMAVAIEDGRMTDAERRVAEAKKALEDAIDKNASEEEIARLAEELKQAMAELMRQMAEEMAKRQDLPQMPLDPNMRVMSEEDIQKMLDRIEELAKQGNKEAAQELLAQLQQMLDGMQMAQQGLEQSPDGEMAEMMKEMEKLAELMREQQRLMDETFDTNQGRRPQPRGPDGRPQPRDEKPLSREEMAEILKELKERQAELQKQIEEMLKNGGKPQNGEPQIGQGEGQEGEGEGQGEGQGQGMGEGMPGGRALGRAGRAMGEAGEALGRGQPGRAYGNQGEALQALREGLEGMMQEMQQMLSQQGQGQMGQSQANQGQPRGRTDPLGRPQRTEGPELGLDVEVPDEIDAERARAILNAIRERLGERFRPQVELDYLERLLTRP